jgi:hypothetical protein
LGHYGRETFESQSMIWNIVDSRRNRFRWAKVHANVEATWHDNSCNGADQVPSPAAELEVVFDERENISVNDAINWANCQSCPVTLYIYDDEALPRSSSDEVDEAARLLDGWGRKRGWWPSSTPSFDDLDPTRKSDLRFMVEGMLRAAARARGQESA